MRIGRLRILWLVLLIGMSWLLLGLGCESENDEGEDSTTGDTDTDTDTDADTDTDSDSDSDTDTDTDSDGDDPIDTDTFTPVDACLDAVTEGLGVVGEYGLDFPTFDHEGNDVKLCDWGGERPVVIQFGAEWCSQCAFISEELANGDSAEIQPILGYINSGLIKYIEVITETSDFGPATQETLATWHGLYPISHVDVLGDPDKVLEAHVGGIGGYPTWAVLDSEYKWVQLQSTWDGNLLDAIDEMVAAVESCL